MIRLASGISSVSLAVFALAALLGASTARAEITWNLEMTNLDGLPFEFSQAGDIAVLDITMTSDGERTYAVGGSIFGFDPGTIRLVEGTTSRDALVAVSVGPGLGFGGLLSHTDVVESVPNRIDFFSGFSLLGTTETGSRDVSPVNGQLCGPQFQVLVEILGFSNFTIGSSVELGTGPVGVGGVPLDSNNVEVQMFATEPFISISQRARLPKVPEPSTALLMGLGLVVLAQARP